MGTQKVSGAPPQLAKKPHAENRSVVVVDVRPDRRGVMRAWVEAALFPEAAFGRNRLVTEVADGPAASAAIDRSGARVAVVEVQLPVDLGVDTIALLRAAHPRLRIVVCTFCPDAAIEHRARAAGADVYLIKPVGLRDLGAALRG